MAPIYEQLVQALRTHWQTHSNAYPQKFILSPDARIALDAARKSIRDAVVGSKKGDAVDEKFMGVPIEEQHGSPGEMVAIDGTVTPVSGYERPAPRMT